MALTSDYWRAVARLPSLQSHWLHFTAQAGGHCLPCSAWSNSRLATSTCLGLCNRAGLTPMLMVGICRIQRFPRISSLPLKPLAPCQVIYTSHENTKIWKLIIGLISIERFGNIRLNLTLCGQQMLPSAYGTSANFSLSPCGGNCPRSVWDLSVMFLMTGETRKVGRVYNAHSSVHVNRKHHVGGQENTVGTF